MTIVINAARKMMCDMTEKLKQSGMMREALGRVSALCMIVKLVEF